MLSALAHTSMKLVRKDEAKPKWPYPAAAIGEFLRNLGIYKTASYLALEWLSGVPFAFIPRVNGAEVVE